MSSLRKNTASKKVRSGGQHNFASELLEVERRLSELSVQSTAENQEFKRHYMGTQLQMCCLTTPALRALLKHSFSFQQQPDSYQFAVWNHIWNVSQIFEAKSLAAMYLEGKCNEPERMGYFAIAKDWTPGIDNWCHSDALSKFYSSCLEFDSNTVLPVLHMWNRSKNPWERRQSLVSLLYYASGRKKHLPFNTMIALVLKLVADPQFYVQRGVGWTLRELGNVYPSETLTFLKEHVTALSAVAYAAATEKLPKAQKEKFKACRANDRKAKRA